MKSLELGRIKKPTVVLLLIAVTGGAIALAGLYGDPLWELFSSRERFEEVIRDAGPLGPLVFILLQTLQILIAPIPGQVTGFAAGYIFGAALGTLYSMIGAALGFALVFMLARKLGRPFVEYFVDKKTLKKFDYLVEGRGVLIFFLIFLLPFFPDDLICYIAGLTKIPIKTLVGVSVLGRLPSNLALAFAGQGVAEANFSMVLFLIAATVVIGGILWWKRGRLERFIRDISKPEES